MENTFDRAKIIVRGGEGGHGAVSFRHEKFVPLGGPDGGEGGQGGNVILRANGNTSDLGKYRFRKVFQAENGEPGQGGKRKGRRGKDLILEVPLGTRVIDAKNEILMADLVADGQEVIVARGGRGGLGNVSFASSTNQAPRLAQKGETGGELEIILELRLLSDVAIIGCPNAGKSSFLSLISHSRPRIADYPFTTKEPVLGVLSGERNLIFVEIPGLLAGAHEGRGLGNSFLNHAMRSQLLIYLIDGGSESPLGDFITLKGELEFFDPELVSKPSVVAINKIDLSEVRSKMQEIKKTFEEYGIKPYFISAKTGEGVYDLLNKVKDMVKEERPIETNIEVILRPEAKASVQVYREANSFRVVAPDIERIMALVDLEDPEVRRQLYGLLERRGVSQALRRAGARPGDEIKIGDTAWPWW
jgi:GTP-binding protein